MLALRHAFSVSRLIVKIIIFRSTSIKDYLPRDRRFRCLSLTQMFAVLSRFGQETAAMRARQALAQCQLLCRPRVTRQNASLPFGTTAAAPGTFVVASSINIPRSRSNCTAAASRCPFCSWSDKLTLWLPRYITNPSGLKFFDILVGDGEQPKTGDTVQVHYTGRLAECGTIFDSSHTAGRPLAFPIGTGKVIRGWDEGIETMRVRASRGGCVIRCGVQLCASHHSIAG